jgi:hypothetical protein
MPFCWPAITASPDRRIGSPHASRTPQPRQTRQKLAHALAGRPPSWGASIGGVVQHKPAMMGTAVNVKMFSMPEAPTMMDADLSGRG